MQVSSAPQIKKIHYFFPFRREAAKRKEIVLVSIGGMGCARAIWHERLPGLYYLLASLRLSARIVNHCVGASDFLLLWRLCADAGLGLLEGVVAGLHQALYLLLAAAGDGP